MPEGLSLSNFKAVLFDVDGTLVDSLEMIIRGLGDTFERYDGKRPKPEEIQALIGMPLIKQLGHFRGSEPTAEELKEMTAYTLGRFEVHEEHEKLFPAAVETLRLCHVNGIGTALVTSKNEVELSGFLKRFSGAPFVNRTVCASDVANPKPAADSALLACELLNVKPHEAVFIGDSIYDIRCAKEAGTASVAVTYGAAHKDVLMSEQPNLLLNTPEELLDWAKSALAETQWREKGS
jgi:pyrophosphatase PpaX